MIRQPALTAIAAPAHVCLIHQGEAELRRVQVALLGPALERGDEAVLLFGPPGRARRLLGYLEQDLGHTLGSAIDRGRLALAESDADAGQHLETVVGAVEELASRGPRLVRVLGPVAWDEPGYPVPEDFLWYESRLNLAIAHLPAVVTCAYDVTRLPALALLLGGGECHPLAAIGDHVVRVGAYVQPEDFVTSRIISLPWIDDT